MNRERMGLVGCAAMLAAAAVGAATVFGEKLFAMLGLPYHFMYMAMIAVLLAAVGFVFGMRTWTTRAGKAAVVGSALLGVVLVGFVALVMIAFSNPGR